MGRNGRGRRQRPTPPAPRRELAAATAPAQPRQPQQMPVLRGFVFDPASNRYYRIDPSGLMGAPPPPQPAPPPAPRPENKAANALRASSTAASTLQCVVRRELGLPSRFAAAANLQRALLRRLHAPRAALFAPDALYDLDVYAAPDGRRWMLASGDLWDSDDGAAARSPVTLRAVEPLRGAEVAVQPLYALRGDSRFESSGSPSLRCCFVEPPDGRVLMVYSRIGGANEPGCVVVKPFLAEEDDGSCGFAWARLRDSVWTFAHDSSEKSARISVGSTKSALLLDLATMKHIVRVDTRTDVFYQDLRGPLCISGCRNGLVLGLDFRCPADRAVVFRLAASSSVTWMRFIAQGALVLARTIDERVRVWDVRRSRVVQELKSGSRGSISMLKCSLNRSEDRLASVSDDGVLSVWDVGSGDEVVNLPVFPAALAPRPLHCNPVVWLESGLSLAVGTREGVQVVSPATPLECGPPPRV